MTPSPELLQSDVKFLSHVRCYSYERRTRAEDLDSRIARGHQHAFSAAIIPYLSPMCMLIFLYTWSTPSRR